MRRPSDMTDLSPREREILALIAQGLTTKAIAAQLQIRPSTVSWHVGNIFSKLGAASRAEAVALVAARSTPASMPTVRPARTSRRSFDRARGISLGTAAALAVIVIASPFAFVSDTVREQATRPREMAPPPAPSAAATLAPPVPPLASGATRPGSPSAHLPAAPAVPSSAAAPMAPVASAGVSAPISSPSLPPVLAPTTSVPTVAPLVPLPPPTLLPLPSLLSLP